MSKIIEDQKPNWPPGETGGYHVFTFGWLVDQLIHRVDPKRRSVGEFFKEEIADKFNLDFWIGFPADLIQRVARIRAPTFDQTLRSLTDPGFALFYIRHIYGFITGATSVEI